MTTVEGLDAACTRLARRCLRGDGRIPVWLLHARHRDARRVAAREGSNPPRRRRPCARRPPVPVHRLADRLRGDRQRGGAGSRPASRQDRDAAARRAELEGGGRQRVGIDVPARRRRVRRRRRTPRRARRRALPRRIDRRRSGCRRHALGGGRVAARGPRADAGEGPGPAHHDRRASAAPAARPAAGRRSPRHRLGRARVPRAGRVVVRAGRRAVDPARQRRRVRGKGVVARPGGGPRPGRSPRPRCPRRPLARGRRAPRPQAPADRGRRACTRATPSTSTGAWSTGATSDSPTARSRPTGSRSGSDGRRCPSPARPCRRTCGRRDSPRSRCSSKARSTKREPIAGALVADDRAARRAPRHVRAPRRAAPEPAPASHLDDVGRARASRGPRRRR